MHITILRPTDYGGLPAPGNCKMCGSVSKESYLDTGIQEQGYGAVLYCNECFADLSGHFGFISPGKALELKKEVEKQYFINVDLLNRVKNLTGAIDGLVHAGYNPDSIDFIELDLAYLSKLVTPDTPNGEGKLGEGEGETPKSLFDDDLAGLRPSVSSSKSFSLFDE